MEWDAQSVKKFHDSGTMLSKRIDLSTQVLPGFIGVQRPPGKRQIKPNIAFFENHGVHFGDNDDESDEEFVDRNSTGNDTGSDSESESETSEDGHDSISDDIVSVHDQVSDNDSGKPTEMKDYEYFDRANTCNMKDEAPVLICSVCLNLRASLNSAEVIQCDRCGIAVHEACYAAEEPDGTSQTYLKGQSELNNADDAQSTISTASTEPWFCESCMFGEFSVPNCELCPSRFGCFKRADIGGGWVHLICALYTPGITFANPEELTGISWQEVDYKSFGRKPCAGCHNSLESRTGITVGCEAWLCKNYYHITCAKRLGLLISNIELNEELNYRSFDSSKITQGSTSKVNHSHQIGSNFLLCKQHNNSSEVKLRKDMFAKFMRQEENRLTKFKRIILDNRQERKRRQQLQHYHENMERCFPNFGTVLLTKRRPRMLHTSSQFLNAFMEKAELVGIDRKHFMSEFEIIRPEHLPTDLPPVFSRQFLSYFDYRDNAGIEEERQKLINLKAKKAEVSKIKNHREETLKQAESELRRIQSCSKNAATFLSGFISTLQPYLSAQKFLELSNVAIYENPTPSKGHLMQKGDIAKHKHDSKSSIPKIINDARQSSTEQTRKRQRLLSSMIIPQTETQNKRALHYIPKQKYGDLQKNIDEQQQDHQDPRRRSYPQIIHPSLSQPPSSNIHATDSMNKTCQPFTLRNHLTTTSFSSYNKFKSTKKTDPNTVPQIKTCYNCKKASDQHSLIYCGTCGYHYHLHCLDPPLKKMPRLSRGMVFECSDCACPSDSSIHELENDSNNSDLKLDSSIDLNTLSRRLIKSPIKLSL